MAIGGAWLHGLKIVAVAVVAQALWGMGKALAPDAKRASLAVAACAAVTLFPTGAGQIGVIVASGLIGWAFLRTDLVLPHTSLPVPVRRGTGALLLAAFCLILIGLPVLARGSGNYVLELFEGFYRAGALVFGGGHVVLPLLQSLVVPAGWVSNDAFLAGYGAAQAVPGPLFTFAAYLGAAMASPLGGWRGGLLMLAAIFLPAFLLIAGALPFWEALRHRDAVRRAMAGINAAVVGVLAAALYDPVWTSAIHSRADFGLALAAFGLLVVGKVSPVWVVVLAALAGWLLS
jgi:chromate transporter